MIIITISDMQRCHKEGESKKTSKSLLHDLGRKPSDPSAIWKIAAI